MISQIGKDMKLTKMSLAVAKDSGWYEVDLTLGENYFWGKGEGEGIFKTTCTDTDASEFCPTIWENACSDNHVERTHCHTSTFHSGCNIDLYKESCKIYQVSSDSEYTYGKDSVCLKREVKFYFS